MVFSSKESKARRLAGMKRAAQELTAVGRIHRTLINGRPPASELRTALAAVTAARVLHRELEVRMTTEGLTPKLGDWGVVIGYVSPDLSVIGISRVFVPERETQMMGILEGQIMLGLVFGMVDDERKEFVIGSRPFLTTKQTDAWLAELTVPARLEMESRKLHGEMY